MDLALSADQQQLLESARGLLTRRCGFDVRRRRAESGDSFDRALWTDFAEMGWFGIAVPEEQGGLGLSLIEQCLVAEEFGRAPVIEPFAGCAVLPAELLQAAPGALAAELLAGVIDGSHVVAVGLGEVQSRGAVGDIRTTAVKSGEGWRLYGRKTLVLGAGVADTLLVVARTSGHAADMQGLTLFALPAGMPGLSVRPARLVDWSAGGDLVLDGALVAPERVLGRVDHAYPVLQDAVNHAIVVLCAEAVGAMEGAIDLTAAYVKERKQFGVPIGSFQALQHRLADMAMDLVLSRSAVYRAMAALLAGPAAARSAEASGCKAAVTRMARWTTSQGIQLHGGYGITEEYQIGHYFKRLLVIDAIHGRQADHLARYAQHLVAETRRNDMPAPSP